MKTVTSKTLEGGDWKERKPAEVRSLSEERRGRTDSLDLAPGGGICAQLLFLDRQ